MENYSKQREEIIEFIKNENSHPTAEEIYYSIKQEDSAISRSTVYRNLKGLVKGRKVAQIAISNGPDRYDYIEDCPKHGYVLCTECGKMFNFYYRFNNIQKNIYEQTGVEISEDGLLMKGVCSSCKKLKN